MRQAKGKQDVERGGEGGTTSISIMKEGQCVIYLKPCDTATESFIFYLLCHEKYGHTLFDNVNDRVMAE